MQIRDHVDALKEGLGLPAMIFGCLALETVALLRGRRKRELCTRQSGDRLAGA